MAENVKIHQRVSLFVDVQNLFYAARQQFNAKVDYARLVKELVAGRQLIRAVAYIVEKADVDQTGFYEALERCGFELVIKQSTPRQNIKTDKPVVRNNIINVDLTLGAVNAASRTDVVVIISGDGTYTPLAYWLLERGVSVEIASFEQAVSSELKDVADKFIPIQQAWTIPSKVDKSEMLRPALSQYENGNGDNFEDEDGPMPVSNVPPRLIKAVQ